MESAFFNNQKQINNYANNIKSIMNSHKNYSWKMILIIAIVALVKTSYDANLGTNLCKLTAASYCNYHKLADWSCKPCSLSAIKLSNVQQFYNSTGDNLGIIATSTDPKAIYLIFRGTVPWDIKNWIEDINFIKMNFPVCTNGCQVHRGFYAAYLEIQKQVRSLTAQYKSKFSISTIIIAGHSLGGALATHAAIDLISQGHQISDLYTYGSPRVGDSKFSQWFDSYAKIPNKFRVTHGRDPVPHLPPFDFGFEHISGEVFYKSTVKNGYKICNDSGSKEDPNCCNQYLADVMVTDHLSYYDIDFTGIILTCQ